jgi:hypothetical protein
MSPGITSAVPIKSPAPPAMKMHGQLDHAMPDDERE